MNLIKHLIEGENHYCHTSKGVLLCGDCLKIMDIIPNNSIDVIITDPPYGITQNKIDIPIPFKNMWDEIKRIRKENTPIILFGQGIFFYKLVLSNSKEFRYDIIWNKELPTGFLNAKRMPLRVHENIAIFYKKSGKYTPQMTVGQANHSKGRLDKQFKNNNYGKFRMVDNTSNLKYPRSIIEFRKPHPSKSVHPTQKSLALMEYLVKTYSNENDIILDFTAGSGTTLIAAEKLNRRWIGIELNRDYCEIIKNRLNNLNYSFVYE